ncbi:MAG TPA: hypothetical protein VHX61_05290 [Rhizomicrobium sp.]|jgi:hypothetical protein|nr:hypothetical protein [Rhizomicrobium sp.]
MLKFVRALGGVCENIVPGPLGRGLFAKDPEQPVLLKLPPELLFDIDDIEFVEGSLRLKAIADVMDAHRAFFDRYQSAFSWGGGGFVESAGFVVALDGLAPDVRNLLTTDFGMGALFEGDPVERARKLFLESRTIQNADRAFLAPLIDLARHSATGLAHEFANGLQIQGSCNGEVLVSHGVYDSISKFRPFGSVGPEPGAFSLPVKVTAGVPEVRIERDFGRSQKRGKDWVPILEQGGGSIELSYLMIGHVKFRRLSRGIFRTLTREAGVNDPDDIFDRILNFNWNKYLNLLAVLEPYEGDMITTLRKMARFQLEAMAHCVGSRDIESGPAAQTWNISIQ